MNSETKFNSTSVGMYDFAARDMDTFPRALVGGVSAPHVGFVWYHALRLARSLPNPDDVERAEYHLISMVDSKYRDSVFNGDYLHEWYAWLQYAVGVPRVDEWVSQFGVLMDSEASTYNVHKNAYLHPEFKHYFEAGITDLDLIREYEANGVDFELVKTLDSV